MKKIEEGVVTLSASDGVQLSADIWNMTAVPTLLLLTAGAAERSVWRPVLGHLPNGLKSIWRVVAVDHRGHGESGRSETYRFAQFVADLQAWISALHASPLVIAGGSIGGALGMISAGEKSNVDGLVLLDVPTVPTLPQVLRERGRIAKAHGTDHPALRSVDPRFIASGFIEDVFSDIGRWENAARRIKNPTLLVVGHRSAVTAAHVQQYLEHIPHGELAALDTGHLVARGDPAGVAKLLTAFMTRHFS